MNTFFENELRKLGLRAEVGQQPTLTLDAHLRIDLVSARIVGDQGDPYLSPGASLTRMKLELEDIGEHPPVRGRIAGNRGRSYASRRKEADGDSADGRLRRTDDRIEAEFFDRAVRGV